VAYQACQGIRREKEPSLNQSTQSHCTCWNGVADPEACGAGSSVGVEDRVGSSSQGWRIHEVRMGSAMEGLAQMGYSAVGIQKAREADGLMLPEEGIARGSPGQKA
jgi:hypothetical protein